MKNNFIKTTDKDTADKLKKNGFKILNEQDNNYIFLNCNKIKFSSDIDKSKIWYSDILCI